MLTITRNNYTLQFDATTPRELEILAEKADMFAGRTKKRSERMFHEWLLTMFRHIRLSLVGAQRDAALYESTLVSLGGVDWELDFK